MHLTLDPNSKSPPDLSERKLACFIALGPITVFVADFNTRVICECVNLTIRKFKPVNESKRTSSIGSSIILIGVII